MFIERSIDKLPNIFGIRKFPGPFVLQTLEYGNARAQYVLINDHALVSCLHKSESLDLLFQNTQAKQQLLS